MVNLLRKILIGVLLIFGFSELSAQEPSLVVPVGHASDVRAVAFAPNGEFIVSLDREDVMIIWDRFGHLLRSIPSTVGTNVNYVSIAPTSLYILKMADSELSMWSAQGELLWVKEAISYSAFSPDGQLIVVVDDNGVRLLDLNGKERQSFPGYSDGVSTAVFSPDGRTILTDAWDNTSKLWDLNGNELQSYSGHTMTVRGVAYSPDGQTILTSSWDEVKLWDLHGKELLSIEDSTYMRTAAFSPGGQHLITGNDLVKIWNLKGELQGVIKTSIVGGRPLLAPNGESVLTAYFDTGASLWNLRGELLFSVKESSGICAFSPDGQTVLISDAHSDLGLYDLKGRLLHTFETHSSAVRSLDFSPDGQSILINGNLNWNLKTGLPLFHKGYRGLFSPDGQTILTSHGNELRLWNRQGELLDSFSRELNYFFHYAPSGKAILCGGYDVLELLDLNGEKLLAIEGLVDEAGPDEEWHSPFVCAAMPPDGQTIFTAGGDQQVKSWNLSGEPLHTFEEDITWIESIAFSPDGRLMLTRGQDTELHLRTLSGKLLHSFDPQEGGYPTDAKFSPDSKAVLIGNYKGQLKLKDLQGNELMSFEGLHRPIRSVAFSPDAEYVLAGGGDCSTKIWSVSTGEEIASIIIVDSTDWIITNKSGLFDASPGAMTLMHYVVFHDGSYEVIELEQLKARYYEPGLLQKLTGYSDERIRPVQDFDTVKLYPGMEARIIGDSLLIDLHERNGGIGRVSIFINGKEVMEEVNPLPRRENAKRDSSMRYDLKQHRNYLFRHPDSTNIISIRAYNEEGWLKSRPVELEYKVPPARSRGGRSHENDASWIGELDPKLYVIAIGTSDYAGTKMDLQYADQDAFLIRLPSGMT